jgi:hypothetical protein
MEVERRASGQCLASAQGDVCRLPVEITLTETELHIRFTHIDGPSAVVNIMDLTRAATTELAARLFGTARPLTRSGS